MLIRIRNRAAFGGTRLCLFVSYTSRGGTIIKNTTMVVFLMMLASGLFFIAASSINYSICPILWGLCIAHSLLLQRSGIVFVPSIMSEPQVGHTFPVGFALMANLHFG